MTNQNFHMRLVQTDDMCPEQYDLLINEKKHGYLRLRNGHFQVTYPLSRGEVVYEAYTRGSGSFVETERSGYLNAGINACLSRYLKTTSAEA